MEETVLHDVSKEVYKDFEEFIPESKVFVSTDDGNDVVEGEELHIKDELYVDQVEICNFREINQEADDANNQEPRTSEINHAIEKIEALKNRNRKPKYFNHFSKPVTVVNKYFPGDWTVVPHDLSTLVIYKKENGHKIVYYNGYKYVKKWLSRGVIDFRCFTSLTCKAILRLSNSRHNKRKVLEQGVHICDTGEKNDEECNKNMEEEINKQDHLKYVLPVNIINYLEYDLDYKTLQRLNMVPDLNRHDLTSVIIYFDDSKNKILYYQGYEYTKLGKKYICIKSARCKATLVLVSDETAVLQSGKHTCNDDNTSATKTDAPNLEPEIGDDRIYNNQSKEYSTDSNPDISIQTEQKDMPSFINNIQMCSNDSYNANPVTGIADANCQSFLETEDTVNTPDDNIKMFYIYGSTNGDNEIIVTENTPATNVANSCVQKTSYHTKSIEKTGGLEYVPVKFKFYLSQTRKGNLKDVPRLDPLDSSTISVYLDKDGDKNQKLVYYKGHTYIDNDKKTLLYMCSRSLSCCAALKANQTKTGIYEVGAHNCVKNSESHFGDLPMKHLLSARNPNILPKPSNIPQIMSSENDNSDMDSNIIEHVKNIENSIKKQNHSNNFTPVEVANYLVHNRTADLTQSSNSLRTISPSLKCEPIDNDLEVKGLLKLEPKVEAEIDVGQVKLEMDSATIYRTQIRDHIYSRSATIPVKENTRAITREPADQLIMDSEEDEIHSHKIYVQENPSTGAAIIEVSPSIKDQPSIEAEQRAVTAVYTTPPTVFNTSNFIENIPDTPRAYFRPVKFRSYLKDGDSEKAADLDPHDLNTVTVFRDKNRGNIVYYKGHTYLDNNKVLYMCTNSPCSAALRMNFITSVVSELGEHSCRIYLDRNFKELPPNSDGKDETVTFDTMETMTIDDNKTLARIEFRPKTERSLKCKRINITSNEGKRIKSKKCKSTKSNKFVAVKIINHLFNVFKKVSMDEQTHFEMVNNRHSVRFPQVMFRGYRHRIIGTTNNDIVPYVCTRFYKCKCDGSILMNNNKIIEYREHFCKGKESTRFSKLDLNDLNTLVIYYNVEDACSEVLYKGFTYRKKWEISNSSQWVCCRSGCNVVLKITDNLVSELDDHLCTVSAKQDENVAERVRKYKAARLFDSSLIPVSDEKDNSFLIYNGYIFYEMENETYSESIWMCIKNKSSECSAVLHINSGRVSSVSKHTCFLTETASEADELQKAKEYLDLTNPFTAFSKRVEITQAYIDQNKYWHSISKDEDKLVLFFQATNKSKYAMYKGYIYRRAFQSHSHASVKWDCIYGGANSSCRGVLTCKDDKPIAVSKHRCRNESARGEDNANEVDIKSDENNEHIQRETSTVFIPNNSNSIENIAEELFEVKEEQTVDYIGKNEEFYIEENDKMVHRDVFDNKTTKPIGKFEYMKSEKEEFDFFNNVQINDIDNPPNLVSEDLYSHIAFSETLNPIISTTRVTPINEKGALKDNIGKVVNVMQVQKHLNIDGEDTTAKGSESIDHNMQLFDPLETSAAWRQVDDGTSTKRVVRKPLLLLNKKENTGYVDENQFSDVEMKELLDETDDTNAGDIQDSDGRQITNFETTKHFEDTKNKNHPIFDDLEDVIPFMIIPVKKEVNADVDTVLDDVTIEISSDEEEH